MTNKTTNSSTPANSTDVLDEVLSLLLSYRVEVATVAVPLALFLWLFERAGQGAAIVVTLVLITTMLAGGISRRWLFDALRKSRVRRGVVSAFASLPGRLGERPPKVGRIILNEHGARVALRLKPGTSSEDVLRAELALATALKAHRVGCVLVPGPRDRVTLVILRSEPFGEAPLDSPLLKCARISIHEPIAVGVSDDGTPVTLTMIERHLLLGGEPGAGKSVALSQLVAAAALDPDVDLWLFDGKLVELAPWEPCARFAVGSNVAEATAALDYLCDEMEQRYQDLKSRRARKVEHGDGVRVQMVFIDELALYVAGVNKAQSDAFTRTLRDVVARGRAAGIIVIAATQKPSIDVVPSALRDLFGFRWALRCATRDASDTVLGSGWAAQGFSASEIDAGQRGVGLLLHQGGQPVRLKAYCLGDDDVQVLADRARQLRH